jgi:replication factor C subunit 1
MTMTAAADWVFSPCRSVNRKRLIIMDEVDGMAGNEDRGGVQELIKIIKSSSVPFICICNDRMVRRLSSRLR